MPDLTEEEKKILRQAYEIKERIKAEELEAGEVSVDEAVNEEVEPDVPLRKPKRQIRPQQDERAIYGPDAAKTSDKDLEKKLQDSLAASLRKENEKENVTKTKVASKPLETKKLQEVPKTPRPERNMQAAQEAHIQKKRVDSQPKQVDRRHEKEERQKRAGVKNAAREEKKTQKAQRKQQKSKKKKGFAHKFLKVLIIILIVLAVLLGGVYAFLRATIAQTNYKPYETSYERQADVLAQKGVTNILLIGTDTRVAGSDDARSDAMIVVSINPYKRRLVMTSIMRDSYVTIPGYGQNRINEAYSRGGVALLTQTIEENYKLGIDYYAQVDFFSFVDVIDAFGGVTINVDQPEVQFINGYIAEYNQVSGIPDRDGFVDEQFAGGEITLTGKQALGYSRIRKIGDDFGRTQRQRTVMNALLEKVKKANVFTIYKAVESILPDISTNISDSKMCSLLMQSVLYLNYDIVQARVPADGTWSNAIMGTNQEVLAVDFEANKNYLQSTIYD